MRVAWPVGDIVNDSCCVPDSNRGDSAPRVAASGGRGVLRRRWSSCRAGSSRWATSRCGPIPATARDRCTTSTSHRLRIDAYTVVGGALCRVRRRDRTRQRRGTLRLVVRLRRLPTGRLPRHCRSGRRRCGGGRCSARIGVTPKAPHSVGDDRGDHPVVHVSWHDAQAYCAWSDTRLPTEAEWEYAARAGRAGPFPWGDELEPDGEHRMNVFQGQFPAENSCADGYAGTAPVDAFAPNDWGLYNVTGNIWEWCADWYDPELLRRAGARQSTRSRRRARTGSCGAARTSATAPTASATASRPAVAASPNRRRATSASGSSNDNDWSVSHPSVTRVMPKCHKTSCGLSSDLEIEGWRGHAHCHRFDEACNSEFSPCNGVTP